MLSLIPAFAAATLSLATVACGSEDDDPEPSGPSYAKDVQPILKVKCVNCHDGANLGNHNIATVYADAKRPAEGLQFDECRHDAASMMAPITIGECSLLLVRAGKMPAFSQCDQKPPPNPSVCMTPMETDVLAAWVAAGMPP